MYSQVCAFCEYWGIGTRDIERRIEAFDNKECFACELHSPAKYEGKETCSYFREVYLL